MVHVEYMGKFQTFEEYMVIGEYPHDIAEWINEQKKKHAYVEVVQFAGAGSKYSKQFAAIVRIARINEFSNRG